jgi:magnesium transporter
MITCIKYSGKKTSTINLEKINLIRDRVWVNVTSPNEKELKKLKDKFKLYPRDLIDSLDENEIPRLSNRDRYSFIVFRALSNSSSIPVGIFLSKNFIITVHSKTIKPISNFFKIMFSKEGTEVFSKGIDFLFYKIISEMNRNLHKELNDFDDKLEKIEYRVLKNKSHNIDEVFPLKKQITKYGRAISSNLEIIEKLQNKTGKFIADKNYIFLNGVHVEIAQAENMIKYQREKVRGIFDIHMSSISNRLNDIMRSFTVLASILLLPMLISGVWGMNFAKIPFYDNPNGFFIPLILMFFSIVLLFIFFRYKKWI